MMAAGQRVRRSAVLPQCVIPVRMSRFAGDESWECGAEFKPSQGAAEAKVIGWREDKNPGQRLAKVGTEVPQISGDEVCRAGFDSCQTDGDVFFGQADATRQIASQGVKEFEIL